MKRADLDEDTMLRNLSIRWRLQGAIAFLVLLLAVIGLLGQYGMRMAVNSLNEVYTNQLASTQKISDSQTNMLQIRTTLDRAAMLNDPNKTDALVTKSQEFRTNSDAAWAKYLALPQDATEHALSNTATASRQALLAKIDTFITVLKSQAGGNAYNAAANDVGDAFSIYRQDAEKLKALQTDQANKLYLSATSNYSLLSGLVYAAIAIAAILALLTVRNLLKAITVPLDLALSHFAEMAEGDLRRPVTVTSSDEMGSLLSALSHMKTTLSGTVSTVRHSAEGIASAASQIAAGNLDLSSRTEQQAAALEETAASMAELTETVKQNAENADIANKLAMTARDNSIDGSAVVDRVTTTMKTIDESSSKVADIISIIEGIAFQTNILALNAAVEAARAGEQGRGFAVVAGEVRTLAQRSSSAAKEIKGLIDSSVERTHIGNQLVGEASQKMQGISESVSRVTKIMAEISTASSEQSKGIDQVAEAVTQMDEVTQQNAALVEEASAAAQSMSAQADTLREAVAMFKLPTHLGGISASSVTTAVSLNTLPAEPRFVSAPSKALNVLRKAAPILKKITPRPAASSGSSATLSARAPAPSAALKATAPSTSKASTYKKPVSASASLPMGAKAPLKAPAARQPALASSDTGDWESF